MIGFLKQLEGSDARFLQQLEPLRGLRRQVHVYAPDFTGADLRVVDGRDGVENVLEALRRQRLAGHHQNALVALADEDARLFGDLFLRERAARERGVGGAEGAVGALVRAAIGNIERREEDQPRAVDLLLDAPLRWRISRSSSSGFSTCVRQATSSIERPCISRALASNSRTCAELGARALR